MQLEIVLVFDKETKNTVRYSAEDGEDLAVSSLYINKATLKKECGKYPESIRLLVEDL